MKPRKSFDKAKTRRLQIDVPPALAQAFRLDCMTRGVTMRDDIMAYIQSRVEPPPKPRAKPGKHR